MTSYKTVTVDGSEIFYREAGERTNPTLLLLHGFPSSSAQYQGLIDRLAGSFHLVAPDYPGFGRSEPLDGTSTFERLADSIEGFTDALGLERFSMYLFDFGAPIGFRLASRRPERVQALVLQNANAYEAGIGPKLAGLAPYWEDRVAAEPAVRDFLSLESTRSQYLEGVRNTEVVSPDSWTLDQSYQDLPGRDQVMLDLIYDYTSNVALYPAWQEYLRTHRPATLITWGANDEYFVANGARAFLADLPDAELHLLDTGHFALATHVEEIASAIAGFVPAHSATPAA
jgi:pimeloyl-ACP methyl ester carboxylesterase